MMRANAFTKLVGAAMAVVVLSAGTVSALDMSIGIQGKLPSGVGGGVEYENLSLGEGQNFGSGDGFSIFFDLTYAELNVGMTHANIFEATETIIEDGVFGGNGTLTSVDLGLLLKYPFRFEQFNNVAVHIALGLEYQAVLGGNRISTAANRDDSRFWIKSGLIIDFPMTERVFLRSSSFHNSGLASKRENDVADRFSEASGSSADVIFSQGFEARFGIGYKF